MASSYLEIQELKKRLVLLETAEADNQKLRKELASIKKQRDDEKTKIELDFVNRLSEVARENDSQVEEYKKQLESLSGQLKSGGGPLGDLDDSRLKAIKSQHNREIEELADANAMRMKILQENISSLEAKNGELTAKLGHTENEIDSLELELALSGEAAASSDDNVVLQERLNEATEENKKLQEEIEAVKKDSKKRIDLVYSEAAAVKKMVKEARDENMKLQEKMKTLEEARKAKKKATVDNEVAKALEIENSKLKQEVQKAELSNRNQEIAILQLERRNHDLKTTCQRLETEAKEVKKSIQDEIKRELYDADTGEECLDTVQRRNQFLKINCQKLEAEVNALKEEIQSNANAGRIANRKVGDLERRNDDLTQTCEDLEGALNEMKISLRTEIENNEALTKKLSESAAENKKKLQELESQNEILKQANKKLEGEAGKEANSHSTGGKASFMIRQLEQSMKREKDITQSNTATLKYRKELPDWKSENGSGDKLSALEKENKSLTVDVNDLREKLEKERKLTLSLRREICSMETTKNTSASSIQKPVFRKMQQNSASEQSRTSGVQAMAKRFESGRTGKVETISQSSVTEEQKVSSDEIDELRSALNNERKQVIELEDELTRQCEINCSLMMEVNVLSIDTEENRKMQSDQFEQSIDVRKLTQEISELQAKLSQIEETKSKLSKDMEQAASSHQEEIEKLSIQLSSFSETKIALQKERERVMFLNTEIKNLKKQIGKSSRLRTEPTFFDSGREELEEANRLNNEKLGILQDKVNEKARQFERIHNADREENEKLQHQIELIEEELSNTLDLLEDKETTIERITNEKEQLILSMNGMASGKTRGELEGLQKKLQQMTKQAGNQTREIQELKAKLEEKEERGNYGNVGKLRAENSELRERLTLASTDLKVAEARVKEFITDKGTSSKSVSILRDRNATLKFEVEKLSKKLKQLSDNKKMMEDSMKNATRIML